MRLHLDAIFRRPFGFPLNLAEFVLVLVLLGGCAQQATPSAPAEVSTPSRPVFTVTKGAITNVLQGTGRVVAAQQQELYFRVGGNLYAVNAHLNDHVKAGQVLATLNTKILQRQIQQAQTAVDAAKLNLEKTQVEVASGESTSTGQTAPIVSPQDVTAAQAQATSAQAAYDAAQAALALLEHPSDTSLAPLQSSLTQAQDGLTSAEAQLMQQRAAPTEAAKTAAVSAVTQAQAQLHATQLQLATVEAGPSPTTVAAAKAGLDLAKAEFDYAQAAYQTFQNGPTPTAAGQAEVAVQQAKNQLFAAQVVRDSICGSVGYTTTQAQCNVANANVAVATTSVQSAELSQQTLGEQTPTAIAQAKAAFEQAQANYTAAELQYQRAIDGPVVVMSSTHASSSSQPATRTDQLLQARLAVQSAQANLQAAQAAEQQLSAPTPVQLAQAQAAVANARSAVASAAASLAAQAHPSPATIAQAQQAVAATHVQLVQAQAKYNELHQLALAGNTAQLAIAIQENAVKQAELQLETLQGQEADMQIVAPFDGIVIFASGQPGKFIGAFQPIITIANPKSLLVAVDLTNDQLGQVALGQSINVTADAFPGENIPGKITGLPSSAIAATNPDVNSPGNLAAVAVQQQQQQANANGIDANSVVITPQWPSTNVQIGAAVNVTIQGVTEQNTTLVPTQAVTTINNRSFVLLDVSGHEVPQKVVLGVQNDKLTEILSGLQVGQKVFASPQ